jgi:acetyl esterase/lipase
MLIKFFLRKSGMWNKPLNEIRRNMETIKANPLPGNITVNRYDLKGVPCEKFSIVGQNSKKAIIYYHGGGFGMGIYPSNREFVAKIAANTGIDTYIPNYRLAPENPFPAAFEDAIEVYKALLEKGICDKDIIVMGDSSGCALALSSLLALRKSGYGMPSLVLCITPVFDLTGSGESFKSRAKKDPFQLTDPLGIAKNYI